MRSSNLNKLFTGGIGSYGLLLMIVAYIQFYASAFKITDIPAIKTTDLLIGFLKFFGMTFEYINLFIKPLTPSEWEEHVKGDFYKL